jgi:ribosomal protein S18 acetylase RimI-like enzyme
MVDQRYQRRGVGRRAMELLLERWRTLGAAAATLSVVPTNPDAITFYESLGFRLTPPLDLLRLEAACRAARRRDLNQLKRNPSFGTTR